MSFNEVLVTIGIPLFNMRDSIGACLESCLRQTYSNFEILIVDDGSIDGSVEFIKCNFTDSRIRIYRRNKNGGVCAAMRDIVNEAHGEYICFIDADDCMMKDRVEKQYYAIQEKRKLVPSSMVACFCGSRVNYLKNGKQYTIDPNDLFLRTRHGFGGGTGHSMYRREDLVRLGNFDPRFSRSADTAMCLKFLMNGGKFAMLREPLIIYNFRWNENKKGIADKEKQIFEHIRSDLMFLQPSDIYLKRFMRLTGESWLDSDNEWYGKSFIYKVKLFSVIPLFSVKKSKNITKIYLANIIPLISIKRGY